MRRLKEIGLALAMIAGMLATTSLVMAAPPAGQTQMPSKGVLQISPNDKPSPNMKDIKIRRLPDLVPEFRNGCTKFEWLVPPLPMDIRVSDATIEFYVKNKGLAPAPASEAAQICCEPPTPPTKKWSIPPLQPNESYGPLTFQPLFAPDGRILFTITVNYGNKVEEYDYALPNNTVSFSYNSRNPDPNQPWPCQLPPRPQRHMDLK